jgi:stearoyl-CoA desaturase (Delta-9 desaturase)
MSMTAVEVAQARGWRHVYLNVLTLPYWAVHVMAVVGIALTGLSWRGVLLAVAFYLPRMFFVTAAYHRYFSHRSFKTSRWFQLVLGIGATLTTQKGPLWWAAHHRVHHKYSDAPGDLHSVMQSGFWWAHHGWLLSRELEGTDLSRIKDFARYPELRWLNRWWMLPPIALGALTLAIGGFDAFVWGFCVGQVLCWHGTFTINSLSHLWGSSRYRTDDDSRNNLALALITLGEGWHNNHHHYQASARQGFYWWEVDITYYVLRALAAVGLIWELRGVPDHVRDEVRSVLAPEEPAVVAPSEARVARKMTSETADMA